MSTKKKQIDGKTVFVIFQFLLLFICYVILELSYGDSGFRIKDIFAVYAILLLFLIGLYFTWAVFKVLKKKRAIEDIPTSLIRSASQGYTEITGKLMNLDELILTSPLLKKKCLWYRSKIYKWDKVGDKRAWRLESQRTSSKVTLPVNDGTGVCFLMANKAEVHAPIKRWHGDSKEVDPEDESISVSTHNPIDQPRSNLTFNIGHNKYRMEEEVLSVDDKIYAIGNFKTQYTDNVLKFFSSYLPDSNKDNESIVKKIAELLNLDDKEKQYQIHTLSKPKDIGYYDEIVISTVSEKELIKHQGKTIKGAIISAILCFAGSLAFYIEIFY